MEFQSRRKESTTVNLAKEKARIIKIHANQIYRSISETISIAVDEYIQKYGLEEKYSHLLKK